MEWYKTTPLLQQGEQCEEKWIREDNNNRENFNVKVFLGKKTDLLKLKKNIVEKLKKQLEYYKKTRTDLYSNKDKEHIEKCPVCGNDSKQSISRTTIYGANYVQCLNCSHIYVLERPTKKSIYNFYLSDITYAATYTDKQSAESRLNAIAVPWLDWTIKVFKDTYNKMPERILDIGSGAGHFVEACRRRNINADGIELNESSRKFAKDIWGFELDGSDFLDVYDKYKGYDIVTFWGLLEHTPNPSALLKAAYKVVSESKNGMIISKLPRWNSLSSASQILSPNSVIRHLDPMGHIMAFTDASAAELYYLNNFKPVAAWYYGMDIYETLMQIGNIIDSYDHLTKTGDFQMELQQFVDENRFSDGLTLVGIPK